MLGFIDEIHENGGTNISAALETASRLISPFAGDYGSSRVILITDGQPNEGIVDQAGLVSLVSQMHENRLTVSALGVGADFNEVLLHAMVEGGGGSYGFIENAGRLEEVFRSELHRATSSVAREVSVVLDLPPGVQLKEVYGWPHKVEGQSVRIPFHDFSSGVSSHVMVRLEVEGSRASDAVRIAGVHVE